MPAACLSTPAAPCLRLSWWKSAGSRAPAAPMRPRQPSPTTILPAVFSLQCLRYAARLAIAQRACGEKSSPAIPGFDAPPTVSAALDGHESGLVGRNNTPDQRSRRGCRALRQFARQRNIGPRSAVAGDQLSRLRRRIAYDLEQVDVAGEQRVEIGGEQPVAVERREHRLQRPVAGVEPGWRLTGVGREAEDRMVVHENIVRGAGTLLERQPHLRHVDPVHEIGGGKRHAHLRRIEHDELCIGSEWYRIGIAEIADAVVDRVIAVAPEDQRPRIEKAPPALSRATA